jgi:predicted transcriptional regulator
MPQNSIDFAEKAVLGWGNRGWLEITELILKVCEPGALKTHIMYKCNLNSKQIQQYLDFLLSRRLVVKIQQPEDSKRSIYLTTERGRRFMTAYSELAGIFRMSIEESKP